MARNTGGPLIWRQSIKSTVTGQTMIKDKQYLVSTMANYTTKYQRKTIFNLAVCPIKRK